MATARRKPSGPSILFVFKVFCVRGRMHGGMQAKGRRKEVNGFTD
jgi:hypothetical protein